MSTPHLAACFATFINDSTLWQSGGTDYSGQLTNNKSLVVGMTYSMCLSQCGSAPEFFSLTDFAEEFGSFMLPYLSLTAQLPFGAESYWDNISSLILTIGSPMLAMYSLLITLFNSWWLRQRFARITSPQLPYPNLKEAVKVLNHLQQSSLQITSFDDIGRPLLGSLVVLQHNNMWWTRAAADLSFTHTWTMANIASILWAVIAYILTIVSMNPSKYIGPAIACAWIWLLPLVVGYMQISPNCDEKKLKYIVSELNTSHAYMAKDLDSAGSNTTNSNTNLPDTVDLVINQGDLFAITVWPAQWSTASEGKDGGLVPLYRFKDPDTARTPPLFNYSRTFSWACSAEKVASCFEKAAVNYKEHFPVTGSREEWALGTGDSVMEMNRTGDAEAVKRYIAVTGTPSRWGEGAWSRFICSILIAGGVQWICVGSAIVASYETTPVGLGCHSLSFVVYGCLATIAFSMILMGTTLRQLVDPTLSPTHNYQLIKLSNLCRRAGKSIAWLNALMFLTLSMLDFSDIFDNCYCGSVVIGLGATKGYIILTSSLSGTPGYFQWWIFSVAIATVSTLAFWLIIFTLRKA